jgi:hypothetical protein
MFAPGDSAVGYGPPLLQRVVTVSGLRVLLTVRHSSDRPSPEGAVAGLIWQVGARSTRAALPTSKTSLCVCFLRAQVDAVQSRLRAPPSAPRYCPPACVLPAPTSLPLCRALQAYCADTSATSVLHTNGAELLRQVWHYGKQQLHSTLTSRCCLRHGNAAGN